MAERPSSLSEGYVRALERGKMGKADLMSAIVNRRMSVHIMPRMSLRFPSMMSMGHESVMGLTVKSSLVVRGDCDDSSEYLPVKRTNIQQQDLATRQTGQSLTFWPNIRQLDSSRRNKLKRLVHILRHLHFDSRCFIVATKRRVS